MRPVCARPVRTLARSCFSASSDLAIFSVVCFLMSPIVIQSPVRKSIMNQGAFVLTHHDALQRALLEDGEYVDRQLLVAAKRERGGVHHLEVLHERLVEGDLVVARRRLVLHRV